MDRFVQDLRFGLRMLTKRPGISLAAVLALALAIGATTAVFSVVNGVLLKPLPFSESERLVRVWESKPQHLQNPASPANFGDWRDGNRSFEQIAGYIPWQANLSGTQAPERLRGTLVSWQFFPLLGVKLPLGRSFTAQEDQPGSGDSVVLSHRLWLRLFNGDEGAVGKALTLNGSQFTVVGVAPPSFQYPPNSEIWAPLALSSDMLNMRGGRFLNVIARLKPGIALEQARSDMEAMARRLADEYPRSNAGWGIAMMPMHEEIVGRVRPALMLLLGAVAFVLLIACANVTNLMLARSASRQGEMAIRAGLGAGRATLIRQSLTESLLVAAAGGTLGLAASWGALQWLSATGPGQLPRLDEVTIDVRILGFVLLIACATALLSGLAPALKLSRPELSEALKEGGRGSTGGGRRFLRFVMVFEVALALMLLIGAGLMIKSFARLISVDSGFNPENVLTMRISLPGYNYSEPGKQVAFYRQLEERLQGLPGVLSMGLISFLPLSGASMDWIFSVEGVPVAEDQRPQAQYRHVSEGYFSAMGISLLSGRSFTPRDEAGMPAVMLVNQAFAKRFLAGREALGQRVGFGHQPDWREVVGVVEDVRHFGPGSEVQPEAYVPYAQAPWQSMALVVRSDSDPVGLTAAIRSQVREIDPNQPVYDVQTMQQRLSDSIAAERLAMQLMGGFAAIALLLATVGIYGVMSFSVGRRSREMGLRMALGARPTDVLRLVVWQGTRLALIAVAVGVAGAFLLTRFLSGLLYEVNALDWAVFVSLPMLLLSISALACFVPAARAARVNPLEALRRE